MPADNKTYREMCQPHASRDAANDAIQAFFNDLGELRKKHKIRDVLCVLADTCMYEPEEGEAVPAEGEFIIDCSFGSTMMREVLAAWIFGVTQEQRRELVNKIANGGKGKKAAGGLFD